MGGMTDLDTIRALLDKTGSAYEVKTAEPITVLEVQGFTFYFMEPFATLYAVANDHDPDRVVPEEEPEDDDSPQGHWTHPSFDPEPVDPEREPTPPMTNEQAEALRRELEEEEYFREVENRNRDAEVGFGPGIQ